MSGGDTTIVNARFDAATTTVVGTVQPQSYDRRVKLLAVNGPQASTLKIYRGYVQTLAMLMTAVFPADVRTYDASALGALTIRAGEAATFAWSGGAVATGQTASATIESDTG